MPRALRHPVTIFGGLLLLGWGALLATRPTPADAAADAGRLAPFDSGVAGQWVPVATLEGDAVQAGAIEALDVRGDTLLLSHRHHVSVFVGGRLHHQFGDATPGAPQFIGRGRDIALTSAGIAQLDAQLHRLRFWSVGGDLLHERSLPAGSVSAQYGPAAPDGDAMLVLSFAHAESSSGWWILRATTERVDTLVADYAYDTPGNLYRTPLVAATERGFVVVDAALALLQYRDADGTLRDSAQRADPPRARVPERTRRRIAELSTRMPEGMRRAVALDEYAPWARAITRRPDGRLLVQHSDLEDASQVEVLAADGQPLLRLWDRPLPDPLFLVRGEVYRTREKDESVVIERFTFTLPPR